MSANTHPVIVHTDSVSYSPIPLDDALHRATWQVRVEFTGYGDDGMERWAVRNSGRCLNVSGEWEREPIPSSRTDEWLAEHRFTRHEAANLAGQVCHTVTWNGHTADEIASAA